MDILLNTLLGLSILAVIGIGAFAGRMQPTTLWVGKKIAPADMEAELPRGFQDAITPKIQDTFNIILPICYVAILILGRLLNFKRDPATP